MRCFYAMNMHCFITSIWLIMSFYLNLCSIFALLNCFEHSCIFLYRYSRGISDAPHPIHLCWRILRILTIFQNVVTIFKHAVKYDIAMIDVEWNWYIYMLLWNLTWCIRWLWYSWILGVFIPFCICVYVHAYFVFW